MKELMTYIKIICNGNIRKCADENIIAHKYIDEGCGDD